jgi:hypothetical protein
LDTKWQISGDDEQKFALKTTKNGFECRKNGEMFDKNGFSWHNGGDRM